MCGLKMKMARVSGFCLALVTLGAGATEQTTPDDTAPSMELLEYLGEWQTAKGEFVDPLHMQDIDANDAKDVKAKANADKGDRHD